MAGPAPHSIGPYVLEELLGRGGMAEVYRARREGPAGFEKVVALKRILPSQAREKRLVERFLEEARIAGALQHGNIVQVLDFGAAGDEYYLVMEWVDGVPLSSVLKSLAQRARPFPPEVLAYLVSEAAVGLHHAHTQVDPAGRPCCIVHRDVSPQNILLSRQGDVKVSDFGIAKAADSVIRTEAGIQVGKLCYMSPEQARGEPLDARSDVYSLAIVLWECLAMRPLFPREEGGEALRAVLEPSHVAPSQLAPGAPVALDAVVLQALMPDRARRYPDADSFARDLRVYLHGVAPGFGKSDLAAFLERTIPFLSARASSVPHPPAPPVAPEARSSLPTTRSSTKTARGSHGTWVAVACALFAAGVIGLVLWLARGESGGTPPYPPAAGAPSGPSLPGPARPERPPPGATALVPSSGAPKLQLRLDTVPAGAEIVMRGEVIGTAPMTVQAEAGRPMRLGLLLEGFEPLVFPAEPADYPQLRLDDLDDPPPPVVLTRSQDRFALVEVSSKLSEAHVLADGSDLGAQPVLVLVRFAGSAPATRIAVRAPDGRVEPLDLAALIAPWGFAAVEHGTPR
ncbi:MAG: serine/threonine protein kinase [Deltaproteobacteria bacterium]|nr:serine/threonine protein kinase [Deltaproteobacteria bacterium]